ncbi:hypothetical protein FB451DRAFT_357879 [Mycena latifolia]|nr:hypothetical protein FB451DRAFT_357879 [Mycena latifolia]
MWHHQVSLLFRLINQSSHPSFNSSLPRPSSRVNPSSLVFKSRCFCGDIFVLLRAPRDHPQAPILDRSRPQNKSYCFCLGGRASLPLLTTAIIVACQMPWARWPHLLAGLQSTAVEPCWAMMKTSLWMPRCSWPTGSGCRRCPQAVEDHEQC